MTNSSQVRALRVEQRERWQQGERLLVEAFLEQYPALHADSEAVLDLIYSEIVLREEHGDTPPLEEYLRRFPQFATQLRFQFEVHQAIKDTSLTCISGKPDESLFLDNGTRSRTPPVPGATGARYEILDEIGRGGMGIVYKALQIDLKRLVALKMILAGSAAGASEQARFLIEAEAVARLQHPNIVQIYEVGEQDGRLFLALELVDGMSLETKFAGRPIPAREAAQLVETLARAIHAAHRHGIIHRDLKPSNVLLTSEGVAKITDFGLAKMLDAREAQSSSDAFLGTPCYMAPEQAGGRNREIGPATDVYALGAVLYELLTGQPPFEGSSPMDTILQVLHNEVVPPSRRQTKTPRDLETICLKCLHKEAGRRYASAKDLADDLGRFLAHEPIQARPVSAAERLLKWMRRRPAITALVLVSVAAVLSLTAGFGWHQWDRGNAAEQARAGERLPVEQARGRAKQFFQGRDEALFYGIYGTLFADTDADRNRSATAAAARQALTLMGVAIEGEGKPVLDSALSEPEKAEILTGCYQLLLVLAEVEAKGVPEQGSADPTQRAKEALAILDRAAQLGLTTPAYHLRRARYLRQVGDKEGARQEQLRADTLQPIGALDYFLRGQERFHQGEMEPACADLQTALAASPDDFWSQYFLAVCYLKLSRPAESRDCLMKCEKQRPDFIWIYLLRSLAYEQLTAFDAAARDYEKARTLQPNEDASYILHLGRGRVRLAQGHFDDALAEFQQAINLKPNLCNAYLELALAYQQQGQADEAGRQLEQALRRNPPPAAHVLRGRVLMQLHDYKQAASAFDRYLKLGGKPVADIYRARGWAYFFSDDWKAALRDFEDALRLDSENGEAYIGRGLARVMLGQYREAIGDAEAALERKPATPEMMHNVACIFSLAASQADHDDALSLAARYREQAVDAVRGTLALVPPSERGSFWREKVAPDKALDAIRNGTAFQQWAQEYAKSSSTR